MNDFNYYRKRNSVVNQGLVNARCPQYNGENSWGCAIRCKSIDYLEEACAIESRQSINKALHIDGERETFNLSFKACQIVCIKAKQN